MLSSILSEYNFKQQVANDVGTDEKYVAPDNLATQNNLDRIADWTVNNKMKLNEAKSNYMVFSRSDTEFATRLSLNNKKIDRIEEIKLVGVWLTTWLDWDKNTREICRKGYARMTMLTKLKYVGICTADLIDVYILYIRSLLEYCSVVWHSTLTVEQAQNLENVQKLSLKIILGPSYTSYSQALEVTGLDRLELRRENRCLQFGLKSLLHPVHSKLFPVNPEILTTTHNTRDKEYFLVNKAKSESYRMSLLFHTFREC